MSEAKDALFRLFALLRLVPIEPQCMATTTLLEKLKGRGLSVTPRLTRRYLFLLGVPFSIQCSYSETPYRWMFTRNSPLKLSGIEATSMPIPDISYFPSAELPALQAFSPLVPMFPAICSPRRLASGALSLCSAEHIRELGSAGVSWGLPCYSNRFLAKDALLPS